MKFKFFILAIFFLALGTLPIYAAITWGEVQDLAVTQGWMVPYAGEQMGYSGIPCAVRLPTQTEAQEIVNLRCDGQDEDHQQCIADTEEWVANYPTCESRNIGVKESENGSLETFDLSAQVEITPTPTVQEQPTVSVNPEKQDTSSQQNSVNLKWGNLIAVITAILFIAGGVYCVIQYKKIGAIEKEIDGLEAEWDDVPRKFKRPVQNDLLMKIFEKERKPIERKIYLLKQKRQFILDKIPLVGWFKK